MISSILPHGVAAVEATDDVTEGLLPEEAMALGRVSEKRRREFTLGRVCARRALAELGLAPTPLLPGPHREPVWPGGVIGSITHCPGYCGVAVAQQAQLVTIGIDAEVHEELPPGVLDMVALDEERGRLRALPGSGICWDRALFSAKESVFKAWFPITRRWLGFEDALVTMDPDCGTFHARLLVAGPIVDGRIVTSFDGRYLVEDGRILTAIAIERSPEPALPFDPNALWEPH